MNMIKDTRDEEKYENCRKEWRLKPGTRRDVVSQAGGQLGATKKSYGIKVQLTVDLYYPNQT